MSYHLQFGLRCRKIFAKYISFHKMTSIELIFLLLTLTYKEKNEKDRKKLNLFLHKELHLIKTLGISIVQNLNVK